MITNLHPYSDYKDSGVEWLDKIPAHWDVRRLKTVAAVQLSNVDKKTAEGQEAVRLCNYTDVYYNEHITGGMEFMEASATPEQVRRFSLRKGDVLVTKDSESWTDIAVPAVVDEDLLDVLCGYHLAQIRPADDMDGRFLARAFSAFGPRDQFQVAANGITRFGLGRHAIRTGLFAIPTPEEQRAIAAFLDRETAKIDALIAKKERLIELLQEKRSALITQAVSKGLDPDAPMKDSGVEWLGAIPAHWEIKPLKRTIDFIEGPGIMAVDFMTDGVPLLRISSLASSVATLDGCNYLLAEQVERQWAHFRVREGDLLISGSASTGLCSLVDQRTLGAVPYTGIIIVRPCPDTARSFIRWFFISDEFLSQVEVLRAGSTIQHFGPTHLSRMLIAQAPFAEQEEIADYLLGGTRRFDRLVAEVRSAIDRVKELRTALISAAVTGKIDVRGEVA